MVKLEIGMIKVKCINARTWGSLRENEIYTITGFDYEQSEETYYCSILHENSKDNDIFYYLSRFKPINNLSRELISINTIGERLHYSENDYD